MLEPNHDSRELADAESAAVWQYDQRVVPTCRVINMQYMWNIRDRKAADICSNGKWYIEWKLILSTTVPYNMHGTLNKSKL